jgi:hypothetical protein
MEDQTEVSSPTVSIEDEIKDFIDHINSLENMLPDTMAAMVKSEIDIFNKFRDFILKHSEINKSSENQLIIKVTLETHKRALKDQERIKQAIIAHKLVLRSFVISLISQYDSFLGRLIRALFLIHPDSLNISEKNITFSQLQTFQSIQDAREYIIEKEVETVLRKSHAEQFDWLEKKFDIKLLEGVNVWPRFIEITERRNLFVHNSGVVNSQYLNICKAQKVELSEDIHLGAQLEASLDYFIRAYQCVFEIGVKLAHVLWRKVQPADREKADRNLNNICYDLLASERFKLARILLDFATNLKKFSNEEYKRMFIINRAQAYKWSGDAERAKKIITSEDWSAVSDKFKLAEAVLQDDFVRADSLLKKIGSNGDITKNAFREWPLFREYRKSEGFLKTFDEVFKEPFQQVDVEVQQFATYPGEFLKFYIEGDISEKNLEMDEVINFPGGLLGFIFEASKDSTRIVNIEVSKDTEIREVEELSDNGFQEL